MKQKLTEKKWNFLQKSQQNFPIFLILSEKDKKNPSWCILKPVSQEIKISLS